MYDIRKPLLVMVLILLFCPSSAIPSDGERAFAGQDYDRAYPLLLEEAKKGDTKAQLLLYSIFLEGLGRSRDPFEAEKWLKMAAEGGNPEALCVLGNHYFHGYLVRKDLDTAKKLFRKAADLGSAVGWRELGKVYACDTRGPWDRLNAIQCLEKAFSMGDPKAASDLGTFYEFHDPPEFDLAVSWYRKDLESPLPSPFAIQHLLYLVAAGHGQTDEFQRIFERLASLGTQRMGTYRCVLGLLFLNGIGVGKDPGKAISYLQEAADAGSPQAMGTLARLWELGAENLAPDPDLAQKWYSRIGPEGAGDLYHQEGLRFRRFFEKKLSTGEIRLKQGISAQEHDSQASGRDPIGGN